MRIDFQAALPEAAFLRRRVHLDLPEGAVVLDALSLYAQKYNAPGILENRAGIAVVVNGTRGSFQRALREGDRLRAFRPRIRD